MSIAALALEAELGIDHAQPGRRPEPAAGEPVAMEQRAAGAEIAPAQVVDHGAGSAPSDASATAAPARPGSKRSSGRPFAGSNGTTKQCW